MAADLYSTSDEEERLKNRMQILGGRQSAKAQSKLASLYKGLPKGMSPKTYDKFRESGTDLTPADWLERQGRDQKGLYEWTTDQKTTDYAQHVQGSEKAAGGMTAAGAAQGLKVAASVLTTLDMLTGGQDKIAWMGSGFSPPSGYNSEMMIGRGV